ncbi:DUF6318 family protein [Rothia nasimurium]|uniref:DUF6318 family protein n=1 Tax=Rothia nasimurium TaxID=85336 RepID=UPI001F1BFD03|nr:DUF6318 family protein [Rothia nasimurium]
MNIPKPHTLLASLAITTLLLTACGSTQQAANLPTPETSSSATADPTATATDTATSTATTDPAQASASPSQAYSGGSKAPEGEYRPADEFGPAQNVPKPVEPAGMNVESPEALFLFIDYWNELRNYAIQTGDTQELLGLYDDSYEIDLKFLDSVENLYEINGWIIGLQRELHLNKDLLISQGDGVYSVGLNVTAQNGVINEVTHVTSVDHTENNLNGYEFTFVFRDGKWKAFNGRVVK